MLTEHAMKSAWANPEKGGEVKEFDSMHDLKMAVVALEVFIKKSVLLEQFFHHTSHLPAHHWVRRK